MSEEMSKIFENCTIVLGGTFNGHTHSELGKSIKENGGRFLSKITDAVTHLVVSEKEWEGNGTKVKQASGLADIKIVAIDWLLRSIDSGYKIDESELLMDNTDSPTVKKEDNIKDEDTSKKRSRNGKSKLASLESDDEKEPPMKKQKEAQRDGQRARSGAVNIPIDEGCSLRGSHSVYIDADGTIFDASLNQTNAGNNNNKFYRIQLLGSTNNNFHTWTRWGRVGESGQNALLGNGTLDEARWHFEKKFKDKSGHKWDDRLAEPKKGKYTFIERSYESDSSDDELTAAGSRRPSKTSIKSEERKMVESVLEVPVQNLMQLIFNQKFFAATMSEMDYDANKLPLGKLSKGTLKRGFERLKELAELIANPHLASELYNTNFVDASEDLSNAYYTVIPHSFGRQRPPVIRESFSLKKEIQLLESLSDMEIANGIMKEAKEDVEDLIHPLDRQFAGLGLAEMSHLNSNTTEFKELQDYLIKSHGSTHYFRFKVDSIFRIERQGEASRFSSSPYASLSGDRRLLWHGSRCTNYGGILSQGLRIAPPEAPVSGYMFGKGVYLADISSKSANYCAHHCSGGEALLLLCEAELGKPMLELTDADCKAGEVAKKSGKYSTWGKGLTVPAGWKDAGCVNQNLKGVIMPDVSTPPTNSNVPDAFLQYNEFICYDVAQLRLRYLFRIHIT